MKGKKRKMILWSVNLSFKGFIMDIISKKIQKTSYQTDFHTVIKITCNSSDITEHFGNDLPYPHRNSFDGQNYTYSWTVDGFFNTLKAYNFINDIKSRFLISYEEIKKINHYKTENQNQDIFKLKEFLNIKSLASKRVNEYSNRFDSSPDYVFWCLKIYTEEIITQRGICDYETLLNYAYTNFKGHKKGFSTVKSKCRSIINYYINKDYKLDKYVRKLTDEELKMTRQENIIKKNKKVKNDNTLKVKNFLSGMFVDEYKINSKWNISKIAKDLKLSRNTIYRIIEEENL